MTPFVIENDGWCEGDLVVAIDGGKVCLSVTETHALDSYNHDIECTVRLTHEQVSALASWLAEALNQKEAGE